MKTRARTRPEKVGENRQGHDATKCVCGVLHCPLRWGGGEGRGGGVTVAVMISLVSSNDCCYDLLSKFTHGEYGFSSIES